MVISETDIAKPCNDIVHMLIKDEMFHIVHGSIRAK